MSDSSSNAVYQLKITLLRSKPPIWRRVLVSKDIDLSDFHLVVQVVMGWSDEHLHEFIAGNESYGTLDPEGSEELRDERGVKLDRLLTKKGDSLQYLYDFGDNWMHSIILEEILPMEDPSSIPACTDGRRTCPPEDCGGMHGYEQTLQSPRAKKKAESFSVDEANKVLIEAGLRPRRKKSEKRRAEPAAAKSPQSEVDSGFDRGKVDEAVLALLALTMHDVPGGSRAWKSHDWEALNRLYAKGYIDDPVNKNKSVWMTAQGVKRAQELFEHYFGNKEK